MIFHGLGFLTDLINWVIASPTKGIALLAIANPLTMTIVAGLVFEGRMVRLWHGQSRSFFPGDLFLWLAASTAIVASSRIGVADLPEAFTSFWSKNGAIIAFVFASVLLWLMRKVYDAPAYARTPGATADSVTKWAHDIFGYWWYSLFLITTGLPMLVAAFTSLDKTFAVMSAVFVLSIAIWGGIGCFVGPWICRLYAGDHASRRHPLLV